MMSEKRFKLSKYATPSSVSYFCDENGRMLNKEVVKVLNEQQEEIEELQVSDEMGWKRAEHFEKKCLKELHNKEMYIKRLEYKVQKFKGMNGEQQAIINKLKEENEQLRNRLEDWHQRTFKAHESFNILEKVIDDVCDNDSSDKIWKEYEKREKLTE